MCQHNLPCSIVLPTACFPEGPSPHFTFCSFRRRRPRLEAVIFDNNNNITKYVDAANAEMKPFCKDTDNIQQNILTDFNYTTLSSPCIFQKTVECKLPLL